MIQQSANAALHYIDLQNLFEFLSRTTECNVPFSKTSFALACSAASFSCHRTQICQRLEGNFGLV